ncbi:MAG TPA: endonuclease/exonuclease/phosphatase family protein [Aliidongia sp.]|nr:endonuclease/exonuclease/phosphatase family protein [Aliidongia sp.]
MSEGSLLVASYNIHSCIGTDGKLAPERIAAVLHELDADIVALQEVDAQHRACGYLDQWAVLAEAAGYRCIPGISLRTHRRDYGNALFTRRPVETIRLHDLSIDKREPRGAIDVDVDVQGRILRIISTHLGLRRQERRRQIERLLGLMPGPAAGTLLLGDLNEWQPLSLNLRLLHRHFHSGRPAASFPSRFPLLALDRILAAGSARLGHIGAHASPLARTASDHLPIRGVMRWA